MHVKKIMLLLSLLSCWTSTIRSQTTVDAEKERLIETGNAEGKNEKGELKYAFRYVVVWKKENGLWKLYRDVGL